LDTPLVEGEPIEHGGGEAAPLRLLVVLAVRRENLVAAGAQHRGRLAQRRLLRPGRDPAEHVGRRPRRTPELPHLGRQPAADFPLRCAHRASLSLITRSSLWIISSRPRYPKIASMSFD